MPRGRNENHKGQSRQFTSVDQLQQELEEGLNMARSQVWIPQSPTNGNDDSSSSSEGEYPERPVRGSGVHSLIKISNPNRPADPNALKRIALRKLNEEPVPLRDRTSLLNRQEREGKQDRDPNEQKTTQVKSDLARLALVRQEREAAAQKRLLALAAKSKKKSSNTKENNPNAGNDNTKSTEIKRNNRYHQKKHLSK